MQLSYNINKYEKEQAKKIIDLLNSSKSKLSSAKLYLNIMKSSFQGARAMSSEETMKIRVALRRFRDQAIDNFNLFKQEAFNCVSSMKVFANDAQTIKVVRAFINLIDDLEYVVNKFSELFDNLSSTSFSDDCVSYILKIQKYSDSIIELIDERIITHIQKNILSHTWVDVMGSGFNLTNNEPITVKLFNKYNKGNNY